MQQSIIQYLVNSKDLNEVINVKDNLFPIYALIPESTLSSLVNPVMEYQYRDLRGGYEKQSQFSINIIGINYMNIVKVQMALNKILDFNLNTDFIIFDKVKFNSQISGGSTSLFREDLKLYQVNLNYLIKWRYTNE
ncbi:hypothetical protein [Clostridium massiliamazoniense]|uniref:hypothetical protein n=1 Tax=Clostridium massiliamazoniense TaxID=1347366 RepID=UPI0006D7F01A|nr:hypothetical protein [Clostridium massiliamazoniense]